MVKHLPKLNRIKKMSDTSDIKRHKVVAMALTESGHMVAWATNRKGSGRSSEFSYHAEELLIKKLVKIHALRRYKNMVIFVTRVSRDFGLRMAKPCVWCHRDLWDYGIPVFYTSQDGIVMPLEV